MKHASQVVAENVRAEMARQGHTQMELAEVLSLPQSSISVRLAGRRAFSVDELQLVADFLAVSVPSLLDKPNATAATA
jgi:transcriptional regulator with XRE-family HTH domain